MGQYFVEYRGKNVLVTGGAGCVGSNLVKASVKPRSSSGVG